MSKLTKVLMTGKTHTTVNGGARAGQHGKVDMTLTAVPATAPQQVFTNAAAHPTAEQLFAGAWSACYTGALDRAAQAQQVQLPASLSVDIEVDLALRGTDYLLQARLTVRAPGLPRDVALAVAHAADDICPYSKAVRGNIDVVLTVLTA